MLAVFVKKEHKNYISEIAAETVGTGLMNKMVSQIIRTNKKVASTYFQFMHLMHSLLI